MSGRYDLTVEQGATFGLSLTWKDAAGTPIDLTGYSARAHIRSMTQSASTLLEMTTANSRIVLGGPAGTIVLSASSAVTAALAAPIDAVWDLELESGAGTVTRLLEGNVHIDPEVTR